MSETPPIEAAIAAHQAGDLARAQTLYVQILAQNPNHAEAMHLLGTLAGQAGRWAAAVNLIRKALQFSPELPDAHYNLALALMQGGQFNEAVVALRQAIRLNPVSAAAHNNLGIALKANGQLEEAISAFHAAVTASPDSAEALSNLGAALNEAGRRDEAVAVHKEAVRLKPDFAEAHTNLGVALNQLGALDSAITSHRNALRLNPNLPDAHFNLALALFDAGRLDEAIAASRQAIHIQPNHAAAHSHLIFALHYHSASDAQSLHAETLKWNLQHAAPLKQFIRLHGNDRNPARRLRIGYVSPDLRDHPVGRYLLPLLAAHDHSTFEIVAYSTKAVEDSITVKLKEYCNTWRSIWGVSDELAAAAIRRDQIDILVDLSLHSSRHRLLVFARKPAPVQTTWLAYPGSSGLETMDYRLTDPHLDPPGQDDSHYSEQSIRWPHTYWCYDTPAAEPPVNSLPCDEKGYITFGCLNRFCKVNDGVLSQWAAIMNAVPGSRLILLAPEGSARRGVLDRLANDGIAPERVEFTERQSRANYLLAYHRIDIALDTFPHAGGTTTCDAAWMGVPTVTLRGLTAVGRGGASILTNLGLPDLIAGTPTQYAQIAAALAHDLPHLSELRRTLRACMQASPLMDAADFARGVESAYRRMWMNWCSQPQ